MSGSVTLPADRPLRCVPLPALPLEGGDLLRGATMAYHLDGVPSPARDNVVVVLHALTGSADAAGDWWRGLIGPGCALDTDRFAVLSPNLLGSCYGSSGPRHAADPFPRLTTRDMARAVAVLLELLRIPTVRLVTGGSLGGMVALEFVATFPARARSAVVFAAPAAQSAAAIGWVHVQREALRVGGDRGLSLARQVAMLTYRTADGLRDRFGRLRGQHRDFAVQEWLTRHGERLDARFDRASYLALLDAMDTHDLARGRGGVGERLRGSGTAITGVGIPGDLFYPAVEVASWVEAAGGRFRTIDSPHGHDAFLIEKAQVGALLTEALTSPHRGPAAAAVRRLA
ncbi:MAG: alpha/beta fold hydrolase [Gemmatimonadales bacterium]|nr:alpha/beta fold hydrolase [Gemmatimonadota bacterium]MCL4214062.1 alpha/beta fold hydrolase [Gemmatimonadales bacterium]